MRPQYNRWFGETMRAHSFIFFFMYVIFFVCVQLYIFYVVFFLLGEKTLFFSFEFLLSLNSIYLFLFLYLLFFVRMHFY